MSDVVKKIMDEYEDLRALREDEKRARVVKVYSDFPEIEAIDREIYRSGAENVRNIIKTPERASELNKEYKNDN